VTKLLHANNSARKLGYSDVTNVLIGVRVYQTPTINQFKKNLDRHWCKQGRTSRNFK